MLFDYFYRETIRCVVRRGKKELELCAIFNPQFILEFFKACLKGGVNDSRSALDNIIVTAMSAPCHNVNRAEMGRGYPGLARHDPV